MKVADWFVKCAIKKIEKKKRIWDLPCLGLISLQPGRFSVRDYCTKTVWRLHGTPFLSGVFALQASQNESSSAALPLPGRCLSKLDNFAVHPTQAGISAGWKVLPAIKFGA